MFLANKALVEKQFGHQIIKLRSDNGEEYVNKKFTTFYTKQGIQQQHTVPYTPQQNGVAEWNVEIQACSRLISLTAINN